MKNIQLILLSVIGLSFLTLFFSCENEPPEEMVAEAILSTKGSINLTAENENYTKLFSSVVYSISDTMVTFWAYDIDSEESFITTFGIVPEIGETKQVSTDNEDDIIFLINGSFKNGGYFSGESGTIKRVTTDKYELNVNLFNSQDPDNLINLSGTVTVGENR